MANRKVLINRHTSGNTAPNAADMYKGEIAVQHKTGEEILWTKNNDNIMVPFISCAQTISIIDSKIVNSDTDVTTNDAHLEVTTGTGAGNENHFDLTTKDVQSEAEFKAYSARTNDALTALTKSLADLLDITLTGGSGDDIITVASANTDDSANTFTVTHKKALATDGFKKLTTDAYGHVTAATDVTTADIQALGFKTSAETGEDLNALSASVVTNKTNIEALSAGTQHDIETLSGNVVEYVKVVSGNIETVINELSAGTEQLSADTHNAIAAAIEGLDSEGKVSAAGKYLTGIGIANGKISGITEADIPVLSVESAGTGNVVSQITVADHKISYTTTSVATSEDIQKLSAATVSFSAATDAKFTELSAYTENVDDKVKALSAGTIQLSADTKATIEQLSAGTIMVSGYAHGEIVELSGATVSAFTAILGMDKAADAVAGQVVTTVSEVDGVVSETKANVKDLQLGGYAKDTTATGDIASTDTINAALSKLENKANAITIANADGSINVTTGATGTDINVNIKSGEKVLAKDGNAGLYTDLDLVKITTGLPETVKERYQLLATDDSQIGVNIDVPKDSHIVSINYITTGEHAQNLEYVYIDASGQTQTTYVDMAELVLETEFASGVTVTDHIAHGVVDPTSESFLTVGTDGFKVSGVQDAIDAKVNALDVTGDTAVAGQYVAAIEQTDGVVAVKTRANVSEAVLTNYVKGTDDSAVAATDTVNQAVSKLENQIDAAKAAATTKVVEGTDAGNNMTITPTTSATDGSVTYTVDLTDVASKAALDAEIAARKAVDGQNGDTYAANANTNFISDATSLNDADVKLDTAIKTLSGNAHDAMIARDDAVFSSAVTYVDAQIDEVYASGVSYTDSAITYAIEGLDSVGSASTTGHYLTSVTITDGKISAVGEVAVPAAVAITATTATPVDTASAVLTGVTATGTDNHELTFGMSNKVFSATTADSAVTSQSAITSLSAQTSVSANMAYEVFSAATITSGQVTDIVPGIENTKVHEAESADTAASADKVANALSVSGYSTSSASSLDSAIAYNGSQAKSLTFGTNGPAGLKSMSMTSAGVVDVEVIDCGEY